MVVVVVVVMGRRREVGWRDGGIAKQMRTMGRNR
jgi:hypothetical protein